MDLSRYPVAARSIPFGVFIAFLVAGPWLQPGLVEAGAWDWFVVGRGVAVALILALFWHAYVELRAPAAGWRWWALAVAGGLAVFVLWLVLDWQWSGTEPKGGFRPLHPDGSLDWTKALLRLAGFALVVPVMEELFWRSLVLRWIDRQDFLAAAPAQASLRAFVITTVLFAIEHDRWVAGAVAGAAYNLLYMRSGNLWVPIVAHAVTNGALGAWAIATGQWHLW
jgi:CAAX prenyl protease-like protein